MSPSALGVGDAGPQLTGTSVWSWSCVLGSHSEITGHRVLRCHPVGFSRSLFFSRCPRLSPWVSALRWRDP